MSAKNDDTWMAISAFVVAGALLSPAFMAGCCPETGKPPPPPSTAMLRAVSQNKSLLLSDQFGNQYSAHHQDEDRWILHQFLQPEPVATNSAVTNPIVVLEDQK